MIRHSAKSTSINKLHYFYATLLPAIIILTVSLFILKAFNDDINISKSELVALHDIQPLYIASQHIQKIRGLQYLKLLSNNNQKKLEAELKSLQIELEVMLQSHSEEDHLDHALLKEQLSSNLNKSKELYIMAEQADAEPGQIFDNYSQLIFEHFLLIRSMALDTNLLLDSDPDIYTLVQISINYIPAISEHIGQLRGRSSAWSNSALSVRHQVEIDKLFYAAREDLKYFHAAIKKLNQFNGLSKSINILAVENALTDYLFDFKEQADLSPEDRQPQELFDNGTKILEFIKHLNLETIKLIEQKLNSRISSQFNRQVITAASILFALLIMAYFITRFYLSNQRAFEAEIHSRNLLQNSEVRQRTIVDTMVDGLITIDNKGIIQSFNHAAETMFGYTADDAIGQNIKFLMPEPYQSEHDGYLHNYNQTGNKKIIGIGREVSGRRKDGSTFPLELSVAEMHMGEEKLFSGIVRDISERTLAEQALNRFKSTLDHTLDCVFMFEPGSLQFFYINAGAIKQVGYNFDELMSMSLYDINPEYNEASFREFIEPMIQGKNKSLIFETSHTHKDGHSIPVDIHLQYISPPGETPRFVAIVRDITDRKYIDKMKNEFISTVSHELRTPLTSIRGSLGLITGGAVGELPEQAKEMLKIANNNTERLLLLINDILDIQKIESGQMIFKFQNLELMPFLQQVIDDNAAYGAQHGVNFVITNEIANTHVFADKDRLMQVMANLLSNAAKFSPKGESVEISVAHQNDFIRISVTDHGDGISAEFQPKLFERFTQSDSSDTRQKGGTGLGLSITKVLVEKHGGVIDFFSREGVGSTFYIDLPELMGSKQIDENTQLRQLLNNTQSCILVVEDDPDVAALLQLMLAQAGFNSNIAYSVEEARQLLDKNPGLYKAITLDLSLPGENGLSFLESLRKQPLTSTIPVVVVSVQADDTKRKLNGGAIGVVDWLQKPIDQSRLIDAIKQAAISDSLPRVLHVEDEADVHKVVSIILREHCKLTWTTTLVASKEALESDDFDLVLLDIGLPDGSGLDLLEVIERRVKPPRVVIFSAHDVTQDYADKVSAVLVKSHTDNRKLADVITRVIQNC